MAESRASARRHPAAHLRGWPLALIAAGIAALAGGCFDPAYPTGIPCSGAQTCPPGQTCDPSALVCRPVPRPDASPAPPDARPSSGIDASIDPCASAPCGPGTCASAPGGYTCTCDRGYEFDGATCADIDECAVTPDPCAPGGVCVNGEAEYTCACEDGYDFDGTTCALVGIPITSVDGGPRRFEDGTAAESCQAYRFPALPYVYEGATGDGVYAIQPPGRDTPVDVFCDMTTDGGGWTAIDPAAAADFGGVAEAEHTQEPDGTTVACQVQAGLFEAFYRGTGTKAVVCQYDIDLGFNFDTLRLEATPDEQMVFTSVTSGGSNTTDVADHLASPWGEPLVGSTGDALLGTSTHGGPVLSLANAGGGGSFLGGVPMPWPGTHRASTSAGTVLRVQVSERGSQDEGYRWTGGRVYVRDDGALGAPASRRH